MSSVLSRPNAPSGCAANGPRRGCRRRRTARASEQFIAHGADAAERGWLSKAAFELHQATDRLYICFLLVRTLYFPRSHNIKFLRSLADDIEPSLIESWARATKLDRRRFELLKRAYVEARYSASYANGMADLEALTSVRRLRDIVEEVSRECLDQLRSAAETGEAPPLLP